MNERLPNERARRWTSGALVAVLAASFAACSSAGANGVARDGDDESTEASKDGLTGAVPIGSTLRATANVNLRSGSDRSQSILTVVHTGEDVVTINRTTPVNGYYNVRYTNTDGWCYGAHLALLSSAADAGSAAASGQQGYLKLDEGAGASSFADASGQGNSGSCSGTTCPAAGVAARVGTGARFDGVDDGLRIAGTSALHPTSTVSVGAYVQVASTAAYGGEVVSIGDSYVLRVMPDGNVETFFYFGTDWNVLVTTGLNVKDGQLHHLVGQKSETELQIFVDGALKASKPVTGTIAYSFGQDVYVGKHGFGAAGFELGGLVDEVRIYDRALSAAEIQAQFLGSSPPPPPPPPSPPSPLLTPGIYGPGVNIDSKNNFRIGADAYAKLSHRFRASTTSAVTSVLWQLRGGSGYSLGTGGQLRITIQSDDGTSAHGPSGIILASLSYTPGNPNGGHPVKTTFPTPAPLTAGLFYHVVFENIDSSPTANYVSVNNVFTFNAIVPRQPGLSDDYAVVYNQGSGWKVSANDTADMDVTYANGVHDGQSYLQAMPTDLTSIGYIDGTSMVREHLTVSGGDRKVTKAFVRVGRQSGSGPLTIRLETGTGTLIEEGSVSTAPIASWTPGSGSSNGSWVGITFASPHVLANGQTYNLRMSTPAGTALTMVGVRYRDFDDNGTDYFRSWAFREGRGEKTSDGGASWGGIYQYQDTINTQTYFTTIP